MAWLQQGREDNDPVTLLQEKHQMPASCLGPREALAYSGPPKGCTIENMDLGHLGWQTHQRNPGKIDGTRTDPAAACWG